MPDLKRRQYLEATLNKAISIAEKQAFKDPKTKKLIQDLRTMYMEGSEEFMFALGLGSAPPSKPRPALPESRIPHLLMVLDALAQGHGLSLPTRRSRSNLDPQPIVSTLALPKAPMIPKKVLKPQLPPMQSNERKEINLKEIMRLEAEIQLLTQQYRILKQEEEAIRLRRGKYGIPIERIKAERLLRELPEKIAEIAHKKKLVEEGVL